MYLEHVALVVEDYDRAIEFFTGALGFDLVEDSPALTTEGGRPKRWVVVRPPGAQTGLLLAQADGPEQRAAAGHQVAGRVGFFLRVDDFAAAYEKMTAAGVEFLAEPRAEPYGRVAVFRDIAGNRWDLLGPPPTPQADDPAPPLWAKCLLWAEFWANPGTRRNRKKERPSARHRVDSRTVGQQPLARPA
jgi:catechol 2,3-dioxygenase-like lactoylglutathione lyase family enzyme